MTKPTKSTKKKKPTKTKSKTSPESPAPSELIDSRIRELDDWRGELLGQLRTLVKEADPDVVEEVKWRKPSNPSGVPVWEHAGILFTGETYKDKVKLTFPKGASLKDPKGLFNASLEGNARRGIDLREGDEVNAKAFKALIRAAVALNTSMTSAAGAVPAPRRRKPPESGESGG